MKTTFLVSKEYQHGSPLYSGVKQKEEFIDLFKFNRTFYPYPTTNNIKDIAIVYNLEIAFDKFCAINTPSEITF